MLYPFVLQILNPSPIHEFIMYLNQDICRYALVPRISQENSTKELHFRQYIRDQVGKINLLEVKRTLVLLIRFLQIAIYALSSRRSYVFTIARLIPRMNKHQC
jgi:hypothetical protein